MALVAMAPPGRGAVHPLPFVLRRTNPTAAAAAAAIPVPSSIIPGNSRRGVSRCSEDSRVRGENRKVMAQPPGASASAETVSMDNFGSVEELKAALLEALEGLNRGIFGVQNARKVQIEGLLRLLEAVSPGARPTENLDKVQGEWKLLYSTISILGSKRTKLGLRDFISLGDFVQIIDVDQEKAVNRVTFSVAGLGRLSGSFTIEASYKIVSPTRVDIKFEKSALVPEQLLTLFQKNYDLLLSIFNPEGWLEITYVDETLRVGRDDKGNVFLLERV